jgi:hypothetical protein
VLANSPGVPHPVGKRPELVEEEESKMCLHPRPVDPVPEETARVAHAAFPKGNTYMRSRDELGAIFEGRKPA